MMKVSAPMRSLDVTTSVVGFVWTTSGRSRIAHIARSNSSGLLTLFSLSFFMRLPLSVSEIHAHAAIGLRRPSARRLCAPLRSAGRRWPYRPSGLILPLLHSSFRLLVLFDVH